MGGMGGMAGAVTAEAGWYYVEGDPPGTVRRWNGDAWIGFPIPDPSTPVAMHGSAHGRHAISRLSRTGVWLSALTMLLLATLAVLFALTVLRITQVVPPSATNNPLTGIALSTDGTPYVDPMVDSLAPMAGLIFACVAITAVVFIAWLRSAAAAAHIARFKRRVPVQGRPQRSTLSIVVQILIFGIFAPIFWGLKALLRGVAGGANKGLFGILSDTAMASSVDAETGVSEIGPIKILIWWALWWVPVVVYVVVWLRFWIVGADIETFHSATQITGGLLVLEIVSLLCIITTVAQITTRLTR